MAGIPVYSRQGRGGGWELLGGGRTDLSGLTEDEARALFMVAGPASAGAPEVRAALRKLVRALPEPFRGSAEAASAAIVVDPSGWDEDRRGRADPAHLEDLQRAVVAGDQVELGYRARDGAATERTVHPLGLARKGRVWYLVAGTASGRRTFRVDRVTAVRPNGRPVERPDDFDLEAVWAGVVREMDERRTPLRVEALVDVDVLRLLRGSLGNRVVVGDPAPDGRVAVVLRGHGVAAIAGEIAGFVDGLEVLGPPEVRDRLAGIGRTLLARYDGAGGSW
jgi:predicted DNA-binding transcriptional regulator YafY